MSNGIDLEQLEDSSYLLDILVQVENVLDSLDIYVFRNWFDGEVVKGPNVRRHWVSISLLYPANKMPDPRGALRLIKHGVNVEFNKIGQTEPGDVNTPDHEPKEATQWLLTITVPRRLLNKTEEADLGDNYEDYVNKDDITAAKDLGLDDESAYHQDEQIPNGIDDQNPMGQDMNQQPNGRF